MRIAGAARPLALGLGLLAVLLLPAGAAWAQLLDDPGAAKAITCSACHGDAGNSRSNSMPIIAGLDPAYFKKQIEAYASGKRPSPEMEPFAKQAQFLGVDDLAAYFARQIMAPTPIRVDGAAVDRGRQLSGACVACHVNAGQADPARLIPRLAGQPPGYLYQQMVLFKDDRRNPGDAAIQAVKAAIKPLSDAQLRDLAAYFASVQ
ncbi:MAG: c-type cytochrome [Candidatus Rokubacteria bacterium]|nr:c-type cytochrome [Candidatus Rokubacteria bacterium]